MDPINEAVEVAVRDYLNRISIIPREDLITLAGTREVKMAEAAYKQAVSEFNDAQRRVDALEAEARRAYFSSSAGFFCFWEYGIIIALVVLMSVSLASAEEVEYQMQWGELIQKYADQLSPEERFIANRMYDALGNTTPEQTEIREALAQADSLDKIQALIGNGVFDLDQPFVHDEAIKERIQSLLESCGYTDCHFFVQHFNIGHYMNEQGWFVQGGHTTEEDGLMDFVIDFECYFYGNDLNLVYFFNRNLIDEPQNTW